MEAEGYKIANNNKTLFAKKTSFGWKFCGLSECGRIVFVGEKPNFPVGRFEWACPYCDRKYLTIISSQQEKSVPDIVGKKGLFSR